MTSLAPVKLSPGTVAPLQPVACPLTRDNAPSNCRASPEKAHPSTIPDDHSTPRFVSPVDGTLRRALHLTKLVSQDDWLPITESRNGNAYYAAFHALCSGIGIQALILPLAFTILSWTWGVICLVVMFLWQLYTLWLLVHLHESTETGMRYSRYLQLSELAFGAKLGKMLTMFPILYLSGGTCIALIVLGGSTLRSFFQLYCNVYCTLKPLTTVEWYLVFTCAAVVLSQLPNMNSIAGVSLVGAVTAVGYCTLIWIVSVNKGRVPHVSYDPVKANSEVSNFFSIFNALGIIAFTFRGHNLILEIQATMPSSEKYPSHVPMWKGVKMAYLLIAMCIFPLAIGGYWAYGRMMPPSGGMLAALYAFHSLDVSKSVIGIMSLFLIANALTSFQIYAIPMFDLIESIYTTRCEKPCTWWLRMIIRAIIGFGCFFVAIAVSSSLKSMAGLLGGVALPVTLGYPCLIWLKLKKPKKYSRMWLVNWGLGLLGIGLSGILIAAGVYVLVRGGIKWDFLHPQ